ncbi:hypothetical protein EDD90_9651 [Streptomyces sp. Ag109_O5-1]|nr:hypothetical protein EDD90_9651 [Streptomyces sp. Ag109_O5-1]
MDRRYEVYALADGQFYDTPDRLGSGGAQSEPLFATARRAVPEDWHAARSGDWLTMTPLGADGAPLPSPAQGWKIHSSATRANAERIAAVVWDYCVPRRIPFKFVPGPHLLHLRNAKYAGRDTSGKFVTVYPSDEGRLQEVLRELGALLEGFEGPSSSPTCAGTTVRCTCGTARSPAPTWWTSAVRWFRRCGTARESWCRTGGRPPSRSRNG